MEHKDQCRNCKAGDTAGIGVYVCQTCNFAIVSVREDYTLPNCPCCEGELFIEYEQDEAITTNNMA